MDGVSLDDLATQIRRVTGSDPLDRVDVAVAVAASLTRRADAVLDRFVADARQTGLSWIEIGARLGVTKQAAGNASPTRRPPWSSIRTCGCDPGCEAAWTGRTLSLRPMTLLRWAPTISSPGLLADGVAAAILDSLGVTTQAIQNSAAELSDATESVDADRAPMLSAEAVCAAEAAAGHARTTAADPEQVEVGTEHLLLVLVMDPGSRARRVLLDLGTDIADIKKELACHVTLNPRRIGQWGRRRRRGTPACSFCGAGETAARPLVHGPGVAICATCTARAAQAMDRRVA